MTWQTYSRTDRMHYLHRIRELFSSRSSRRQLLYRLQHRYQYRLSRDPLDREASAVGDPADTAGGQPGEGMEEVPDADPVNQVDYTDLLTKQNELLESQQELLMQIVLKDEQIEHDMKNVQNAMPAVMCMLGVVIGVLLVHILASYIRP